MKDEIISLIRELPDDADIDDIMEALIVRQKIMKGIRDSEEGNYYTHDEAKEILEKWLKSDG
nr:hypothetical protein [Candidatus Sigynarchaeota archaeon]